jgi:hypothetical protein
MPWRPSSPGEIPTLGFYALDWIGENLAAPDRQEYEPFVPTREQAEFTLRFYELDAVTGRRKIRRGVLSRSRGWGKSPFLSALAILESLGDVVPDGWDAEGQPVGKPWASVRTPSVVVAAATEDQVFRNSWPALLEMLGEGAPVLENYPGLEPLESFVILPGTGRARILPVAASATSVKGLRAVFTILDQTEMWTRGNGGVRLAETLINNATKIGGSVIETPNAYIPGEGSVAENSAGAYFAMLEGRTRMETGLLYDHREAPGETDLTERESLTTGLRYAYGDSSDHPDGCVIHDPPCQPGWSPLDDIVARIWDLDADEQQSRGDFLNQITHASDAWISGPEWSGCLDRSTQMAPRDAITLGFDGSRGRAKGKPDATALVGCRVRDGHLFEVAVWEADDKATWETWEPPLTEIEATLTDIFTRYRVVGFYADPAKDWRSYVNAWEARWGSQVEIRARREHPFEWWMTGGRSALVQQAVEQLEGSIRNRDATHDGSLALTRHMLNARRRLSHRKLALAKSSDYSERKIDAAVAAVLAWQARLDALAKGAGLPKSFVPSRIR